jgi:uncharacterized protein (UPF0276 family)
VWSAPYIGHGVGLRPSHYRAALADDSPRVDWFEVISENFMVAGGNPRRVLRKARERAPVVLHGVSMCLGSSDPLDAAHLEALAALARDVEPAWISEHVSWGSHAGQRGHDLWPLPYTEESLAHVAARVARVQERLGRRILVENVSAYLRYAPEAVGPELDEAAWLAELARRADCGLLVDVNNVYVSARNLGFDAAAYIDALPVERIGQVHLAGHSDRGDHLLDTHDQPVSDAVWALYRRLVARTGPVSTLIEWDGKLPSWERLVDESRRAAATAGEVSRARAA